MSQFVVVAPKTTGLPIRGRGFPSMSVRGAPLVVPASMQNEAVAKRKSPAPASTKAGASVMFGQKELEVVQQLLMRQESSESCALRLALVGAELK